MHRKPSPRPAARDLDRCPSHRDFDPFHPRAGALRSPRSGFVFLLQTKTLKRAIEPVVSQDEQTTGGKEGWMSPENKGRSPSDTPASDVTRRDFLKGASLTIAGVGIAGGAAAMPGQDAPGDGTVVVGPGQVPVEFTDRAEKTATFNLRADYALPSVECFDFQGAFVLWP